MSRLPLDSLEVFVQCARLRNMTRAADTLFLTVSAVSHRLRQLEMRMGQRLLERGPRGVRLTLAGERLFETVAPALEEIERAMRQRPASPRVLLSLLPLMATGWLLPRMTDFVARHPEVAIDLQCSADLVDFAREPVDFALRLGNGGWPGVQSELLFEEWMAPVASPALLARLGIPPQQAQLQGLPLLGDPGGRWRDWFRAYGGTEPERYLAHLSDAETLHQAAVQGLGVALARLTLARPLIDAGLLLRLGEERLPAGYGFYLVYPERSRAHPHFSVVREWLLREATASKAAGPPGQTPV
jgi:LysR family glycine cleavage system transcriptional activator